MSNLASGPQKLYSGTKSMFSSKPKPRSRSAAGKQPAPKKPSMLSALFMPEEPKKPRTVGEWMSQKRLDP